MFFHSARAQEEQDAYVYELYDGPDESKDRLFSDSVSYH